MVYSGKHLKEISFPLGGIGSGSIGLAGNGTLLNWEIFNRPNKGSYNDYCHFAVKAEYPDGRVVTNFIKQAFNNEDITIYGDGSQTRSFCYIDDLIDGLIKMMATSDDVLGPINLGNDNEFTIKELANLVKEKVNPNLNIINKSLPQDDPTQRKPDVLKAKELLKTMHEVFCSTHKTDCVDDLDTVGDEFVSLPAVIKSDKTGEICVGLVYVDIESSGEHWGTAFAFSNGFVNQEDKDILK